MTSKFIKVQCKNCKNTQTVFEKASTMVKCLKCNEILARPTGGKAKIYGRVVGIAIE